MPATMSFKLTLLFNQRIDDLGGNWQYVGASGVEQTPGPGRAVQVLATKRENSTCCNSFPVSMLTAAILFAPEEGGVAPNITLQGVHDLTTNNETGSVSAASLPYDAYIGSQFTFNAATGVLTIA
jgi:hypothetical protein